MIFFGYSSVFLLVGVDVPGGGTTFGNPGTAETLPVEALLPELLELPYSSVDSLAAVAEDDSLDNENRFGLNDKLATLLVTYCCKLLKKLIVPSIGLLLYYYYGTYINSANQNKVKPFLIKNL